MLEELAKPDSNKGDEALSKIDMQFEPISLLQTSQFGETYLIREKPKKNE